MSLEDKMGDFGFNFFEEEDYSSERVERDIMYK